MAEIIQGEIAQLFTTTMAGVRQSEQRSISEVGQCGWIGNRMLVGCFAGRDGTLQRLDQKRLPKLAQLSAQVTSWAAGMPSEAAVMQHDVAHDDAVRTAISVPISQEKNPATWVDEFGEQAPVVLCSDVVTTWFRHCLEDIGANKIFDLNKVRLAQHTIPWQLGAGRNPERTTVAPMHMDTCQTVDYIDGHIPEDAHKQIIDARRLRPDIVLDVPGLAALGELAVTAARVIPISGQSVVLQRIPRQTVRCGVPSIQPMTGELMHDVSRTYPLMPKDEGGKKAVIGVYMRPVLAAGQMAHLTVGDRVELEFGGHV